MNYLTNSLYIKDGLYIVGCRGASQLGGSLLGIPPGYKANKLTYTITAREPSINECYLKINKNKIKM